MDQDVSEAAFQSLYAKYKSLVFGIAYRQLRDFDDALDITQETFVALLRAIRDSRDFPSIEAYLAVVARNKCISALRTRRARRLLERRDQGCEQPRVDNGCMQIDSLLIAVKGLPNRQREMLTLRYLRGKSLKSIAATLGLNPSTVRANIHFGKKSLRRLLAAPPPENELAAA